MKGIYCLEGIWEQNLVKNISIKPILDLLKNNYNIPNIYHDVATFEEFEFFIDKYKQKQYSKYPILYLAFHGDKHKILVSKKSEIYLDDLSELLEFSCRNKIILFGSCSTLNIDKRFLRSFLNKTDALAVCGYKSDVDWLKSTAFELLLIDLFQDNKFDKRGIKSIYRKANVLGRRFSELEFRMVIE